MLRAATRAQKTKTLEPSRATLVLVGEARRLDGSSRFVPVEMPEHLGAAEGGRARAYTFSIVVPAYDRASAILPALRSVQAQDFSDFECIVVDDGSADGPHLRSIVEDLGDARFQYLRRPHGGAAAARNAGIDAAKGRFIAFLDSDDRYLRGKLSADHRVLVTLPPNIVVFSQVYVDRGSSRHRLRPSRAPRLSEDLSEYLACHQGFIQPSTVAMDAGLARRVGFAEDVGFFADDTDFAIRLAAAGVGFHMHPRPMVIMDDSIDPARLSQQQNCKALFAWLDRVRPIMSDRAYYAYRGWHGARVCSNAGQRKNALGLYWAALRRGAFPPRLAAKALGQILIRQAVYRRLQRQMARVGDRLMQRTVIQRSSEHTN